MRRVWCAVLLTAGVTLSAGFAAPALAFDPEPLDDGAPAPTPAPVQVPPGLYRVTEIYVADVVTRSGDFTTYATLTAQADPGTWARVLDTVDTGERSPFDGRAFNGRRSLSDGAALAGSYYETFVRRGEAFVPWSIVFFQDDSELARRAAPTSAPRVTQVPTPPPPAPGPAPVRARTPSAPPSIAAPPIAPPTVRPLPSLRIGVDPTGGQRLLSSLEVARGRRYGLRVNVEGIGAPVVLESWTLQSGTNDAWSGAGWRPGSELLPGQWLRLPRPGTPWSLTLGVRARVVEPAARRVEASGTITIWVRAPAVVE